ncbi:MAG: extracellular solute-binding protein [Anaerolineae bacterium]
MSKKRLTRRSFLTGVAAAGAGAALAACAPEVVKETVVVEKVVEKPVEKTVEVEVEKVVKETVVVEKVVEKEAEELEGEIVVNVSVGSPAAWEVVANMYEAAHPKVDVILDLKRGDNDARDQFYRAQVASGAPRMSLGNINSLGDLFGEGVFVNWDDYMDRINPYTGEVWRESFAAGALDVGRYSPTEQYMLSIQLVQILFFFNQNMAAEIGLDPSSPPQTWDELAEWLNTAADAGYIGMDMIEKGDRIDWFERIYADTWYSTKQYWDLVKCHEGDFCYDPDKADFMTGDWQNDPTFDDPDKVDYNKVRAYANFRDGWWLTEKDERIVPMMNEMRKVINPTTLAPGWRGITTPNPLLFYSGRALCVYDGGWMLSSFDKSIKRLQAGEFLTVEEGEPTPTPDPALAGVEGFDLGLFPSPQQTHPDIEVNFQRTIEQPIGFWGIPVKDQKQNELEIDFAMFCTSPKVVAARWAAELDPNNAEGSVIGPPAINGVEMPGKWKDVFGQLKFQGNCQKPHPKGMTQNGLPGNLFEWRRMMADFYDGDITAEEFRDELRTMRDNNFEEELKTQRLTLADLDTPEKKPPTFD